MNGAHLNIAGSMGPAGLDPSLLRASDVRLRDDQRGFAAILAQHTGEALTPQQRAREAAEQLVSAALVQPIFKRMRESNQAAPPFGPNQAERTFGGMLDAAQAQRMVSSQRWGLVDQLARRMLARTQPPVGLEAERI